MIKKINARKTADRVELLVKLTQLANKIGNQIVKMDDKSSMATTSILPNNVSPQIPPVSRQEALTEALIKVVEHSEDKFEKLAEDVSNFKSPRTYGKMAGATVGGIFGGQTGASLGQTVGEELGGLMGGENVASQQVNMIRLQQASQEMNVATTTVSNILKGNGDVQKAIAQNIRA